MYSLKFDKNLLTAKEATLITSNQDGLAILNYEELVNREHLVVGIHNGMFHADEVLALVLLKEALGLELEIVRSRNPKELEECDIRVDVGEGLLDHHGKLAESGVAACTKVLALLVQTELSKGNSLKDNEAEINYMEDVVNRVAAWDCGDNSQPHPFPWVHSFAERSNMERDEKVVMSAIETVRDMISNIMGTELTVIGKKASSARLAEAQLAEQANEKVVVFNADARWADVKQMLHTTKSACIFYISPEAEDDWRILCAADPEKEFSPFSSRLLIPEQFRGFRGEELSAKSGIEGGIFCHAAGFIAGFKSCKAAVAFAKLALEESVTE